jgi:hypothetical protein
MHATVVYYIMLSMCNRRALRTNFETAGVVGAGAVQRRVQQRSGSCFDVLRVEKQWAAEVTKPLQPLLPAGPARNHSHGAAHGAHQRTTHAARQKNARRRRPPTHSSALLQQRPPPRTATPAIIFWCIIATTCPVPGLDPGPARGEAAWSTQKSRARTKRLAPLVLLIPQSGQAHHKPCS